MLCVPCNVTWVLAGTRGDRVFVKTYAGKRFAVEVRLAFDSVKVLYQPVFEKTGLLPHEQRFIFAGMQLNDSSTLSHYGIQKESTVDLEMPGEGRAWLAQNCLDEFGAPHPMLV